VEAASLTTAPPSLEWLRLARRARLLSWLSLVLIGAEGAVAIAAGIAAGSIALIGFGIDSAIEGLASLVIVWRFSGSRLLAAGSERRAQRLVAIQFFLLAPYVAAESVRALVTGDHADPSWVGIGLALASLATMPALGVAKQRLAARLGSSATHGEGRQNMLCAYLAAALLAGLLGNALLGLWWLDPAVGLAIAAVALVEGARAWRGDVCCAHG
jgi:divalent metal cation (Fe/Co/Zn/Cd) transporter